MARAVSLPGVLGLLLVSALPGVLGDRPGPDVQAHPGAPARGGSGAAEPRRRPSPKDQRERARAEALPLGLLYTAAVVAFVLYKCLQRKDEAAVLQEEASKKEALQSEQQLAQLTQQLAQTEQHLNHLMAQLDPLFERVTALAGAQQELLSTKLQTFHQLLQENKPDKNKPDKGLLEPGRTRLGEASTLFPEDLYVEDDQEEADSQTWGHPTETWDRATSQEVAHGLRRRSKAAANGPGRGPSREGAPGVC
ncbi:coiled-coil domain-containing protein 107 [Lepus europaeus]|uniref:coiled-coil domain-containing protein 107 n=1 Tax=Lepus europaeus TaxID=9983 RepID=UPI002B45E14C|nr:coiled-coil domain-containing protein 107 [Lepus europaeus]